MSIYVDKQYAQRISPKLDKFKWIGVNGAAQFRCPICGDSKKNKYKCRGALSPYKGMLRVTCYNCGYNKPFGLFLKSFDPVMFKEYCLEVFKDKHNGKTKEEVIEEVTKLVEELEPAKPIDLKSIQELEFCHPAVQYVHKRKIPTKDYANIYYTDNYKKWVTEAVVKGKFKAEYLPKEDPRIVIPFQSEIGGPPFAFQGRTILKDPKIERYITITVKQNAPLIYGLDRVDQTETIYVVEGPIDSLFIPNAIAVAGSGLTRLLKYKKLKLVFIFDNEPRSPEICKIMEKIIDAGKKIVIWPRAVKGLKDVNDMVIAKKNVLDILEKNCYDNVIAKLKYNEWKKI